MIDFYVFMEVSRTNLRVSKIFRESIDSMKYLKLDSSVIWYGLILLKIPMEVLKELSYLTM